MVLQRSSMLPFILLGAAAALVNACGSDGGGVGASGGAVGSAGTAQAGRGGSGGNVAGSANGGAPTAGSSNAGAANGGSANGGTANGGSSNGGTANAGAANGGTAGASMNGGSGGNSGTSSAGAGGNPAGGGHGGSAGSGGATGVDPKLGCSKLVFSFGLDPDDTPTDGSKSACGGEVGDDLSTLTFDYAGFPTFSFKVANVMGTGKTGDFATVIRVESRDLFASPWQSTDAQCSLHVTSNETFTKVARVTGSITCTPKTIPEPPPSGGTVGLDIEKWEFTMVVPLQQ